MSCILMLQGRIGKIDKKLTTNNITVVKVSIASSNDEKDKDGNYKTEWTDVTAYGKKAEYIFNNAHKGDIVTAIAKKQTDKYVDSNGINKYFINFILCESFYSFQILYRKNVNNNEMDNNKTKNEKELNNIEKNDVNNKVVEKKDLEENIPSIGVNSNNLIPNLEIEEEIPF